MREVDVDHPIGTYVRISYPDGDPVDGIVVGEPARVGVHTIVSGDPPNHPGDHPDYDPRSDTRRFMHATRHAHGRVPVKLLGDEWDYENPNLGYEGTTFYFPPEDLEAITP